MNITLFDYQKKSIDILREDFKKGIKRNVLVIPCGGGKTVIAGNIIQSATLKNNWVLFLVHRKELIDQAHAHLFKIGIDASVIMGKDSRFNPLNPVQLASFQTLNRNKKIIDYLKPKIKLVFVDECHHSVSLTYLDILLNFIKTAKFIGLTATPYRMDNTGLGKHNLWEKLTEVTNVEELINKGRLVRPVYYEPDEKIDLSFLTAIDNENNEISPNSADILYRGNIIENWKKISPDAKTLIYANNTKESNYIIESFRKEGYKAQHIDFKTPKKEREKYLRDFNNGNLKIISNLNLFDEGVNIPDLEAVIILKDTGSKSQYIQICGRVSRTAKNKRFAHIHDHVGIRKKHGYFWDKDIFSLESGIVLPKGKSKRKESEDVFWICNCGTLIEPEKTKCPECGQIKAFENKKIAETNEILKKTFFTKDEKQEYYTNLCQICLDKKRNPGWVAHAYKQKFNVWPKCLNIPTAFKVYKDNFKKKNEVLADSQLNL